MSCELINQVVELTNAEREKVGLQPLQLNAQLVEAAQYHSNDMAENDFFNHTGVDGSTLTSRLINSGYQYSSAGENIAAGQQTAAEVVTGWMSSAGHRFNLLDPDFTEIGIGYTFLENDTGSVNYYYYWTQVFGTPINSNNTGNTTSTPCTEDNNHTQMYGTNDADTIIGGDSNQDLRGNAGDDLVYGLAGNDSVRGNAGDDTLHGGTGNDTMFGHDGNDIFIGVDVESVNPGAGERDVLFGNGDNDTFVLGDENLAYYQQNGSLDYAWIKDFQINLDTIQLHGSMSDYQLQIAGSDTNILYGNNDELIGVIRNVTNLNLSGGEFSYV